MYVWCRIKSKGVYLGRSCPCDGLYITDEVYQILRATGLDIEIYDPEEEKRKRMQAARKVEVVQVKEQVEVEQPKIEETKKEEPVAEVQEVNKVEDEVETEDEVFAEDKDGKIVQIKPGNPSNIETESSFIQNVKDELFAELQSDEDDVIDKELEDYVSPSEQRFLNRNTEVEKVSDAVESKEKEQMPVYTEEELNLLSRNELCQILFNLGHKGGRDPMAPKQKEKKDSIIRKIIECTSN